MLNLDFVYKQEIRKTGGKRNQIPLAQVVHLSQALLVGLINPAIEKTHIFHTSGYVLAN